MVDADGGTLHTEHRDAAYEEARTSTPVFIEQCGNEP